MAAAGGKVTWGNEGSGNSGTAGRGTIYNPNTGNATQVGGIKGDNGGVVSINGNVIAGNDGNYYRRGADGGWEQVSRPPGTAAPAQRQSQQGATARQNGGSQAQWQQSAPSPQQRQALERQNNARQSGAQRQSSYQSNRPTYSRGGGGRGGGGRGGGGRR